MSSSQSITIESLELELTANTASASKGINSLAQSLEKLKKITGSIGLEGVIKQFNALGKAVGGINSSAAKNLDSLARAIQALSGAGRPKDRVR